MYTISWVNPSSLDHFEKREICAATPFTESFTLAQGNNCSVTATMQRSTQSSQEIALTQLRVAAQSPWPASRVQTRKSEMLVSWELDNRSGTLFAKLSVQVFQQDLFASFGSMEEILTISLTIASPMPTL